MRSLFVALTLLILAPASAPATAARPGAQPAFGSSCPDDPAARLARSRKDGGFHKLAELPPAEAYAAVYRRGPDGCMIPVLFRERNAPPARRR